jgi:hypothetical protein
LLVFFSLDVARTLGVVANPDIVFFPHCFATSWTSWAEHEIFSANYFYSNVRFRRLRVGATWSLTRIFSATSGSRVLRAEAFLQSNSSGWPRHCTVQLVVSTIKASAYRVATSGNSPRGTRILGSASRTIPQVSLLVAFLTAMSNSLFILAR